MATRKSTQKHEVYHANSGQVVITGVSKTDANKFRVQMDNGRRGTFAVRPVRRAFDVARIVCPLTRAERFTGSYADSFA